MKNYIQKKVSNGNPREQALIRRWWCEKQQGRGLLVWEYNLEGKYADAIWFPNSDETGERPGKDVKKRFPIRDKEIVLCEAKIELIPWVIGQALVYTRFAIRAGAHVRETVVFAETGSPSMIEVSEELGLSLEIGAGCDVKFMSRPSQLIGKAHWDVRPNA